VTAATGLIQLSEVRERFRDSAARIDSGDRDVREGLSWLGSQDLIVPPGSGLPHAVTVVEQVAGECMSSAFSLWAHRMVWEYLHRGATDTEDPGRELAAGRQVGSTAMAPALRDVAGLEPVPVRARPGGGGLVLSGPIRWASNLFEDAVVVLPVRTGDGPDRAVVRFRMSDPGVGTPARPELLALNGTASGSVWLEDVVVPADAVLSTDLPGFVRRIRPAFLLLQTAFCAGLALRSVGEAVQRTAGPDQSGPAAALAGDVAVAATRADSVHQRLYTAAADPDRASTADLLRLRLDAAAAASEATRLEATVRGGAGYVAGSDVSRRLRESAFLPIQAPTEGQLRWELSRST
jgi:alkylation response protein AidB-like acyl-CoA dehydrogenase